MLPVDFHSFSLCSYFSLKFSVEVSYIYIAQWMKCTRCKYRTQRMFCKWIHSCESHPDWDIELSLPKDSLSSQCDLPLHRDSWRVKLKPWVLVITGSVCCPLWGDIENTSLWDQHVSNSEQTGLKLRCPRWCLIMRCMWPSHRGKVLFASCQKPWRFTKLLFPLSPPGKPQLLHPGAHSNVL